MSQLLFGALVITFVVAGVLWWRVSTRYAELSTRLALSESGFQGMFDAAAIGLALVRPDGSFKRVNPALASFFGYSEDELLHRTFQSLTHPDDLDLDEQLIKELLDGHRDCYFREKRYLRKDGQLVWASLGVSLQRDINQQPLHFVSQIQDITERKRQEELSRLKDEKIHFLAYHDALTGLPNRYLLQDRLRRDMAQADRSGRKVAVLFLDLDRFKTINDILGHKLGDDLLQHVAERLASCARDGDTVARLGGDEFLLVLPQIHGGEDVSVFAERLLKIFSEPIHLEAQELNVTPSIGISLYPDDGADVDTLMKNADTAMYRAKKNGRNNYRFFAEEMTERALEGLKIENGLRKALERNELRVWYQPKVQLSTGRITGMEALVRWQHPDMGLISPAQFIPLAEEIGLIVPIGEWVLRTAIRDTKRWHQLGYEHLQVAVNVSSRQFLQPHLAEHIGKMLAEEQLEARFLELELTESLLLVHAQETIEVLEQLKEMGVRLSIDDFGTGYSNLSYLRQYTIDSLKIDQTFVQDIDGTCEKHNSALAVAILNLAQNLQKRVIAEGVETASQFDFLRSQNCDEVQGFFLSIPLPNDQFTALLEESQYTLHEGAVDYQRPAARPPSTEVV